MPEICLVKKNSAAMRQFRQITIEKFADELVTLGDFDNIDESLFFATRIVHEKFFTNGNERFQDLCDIVDQHTQEKIGDVWYSSSLTLENGERIGRICYLYIAENYRQRGYATATMTLIEATLMGQGIRVITLTVFAHNPNAKYLFEQLGYDVIEQLTGKFEMQKALAVIETTLLH